jgi:CubicO group peptidase (beta-lactamase class C family)
MNRRLLLFFLACLLAFGALPSAPQAQAAHGIPTALFDPTSTSWYSIRNMTPADHQNFFNSTAANGFMMIDAERHVINGQLRVSSVWQRNTDGRGWASRSNLTSAEFSAYWEQYRSEGYRLIDQEAYTVGGQLLYSGIWVENTENLGWASLRNLTGADFATNFATYSRDGFMLVDTEAYNTPSGLRYSQIWVENTQNIGWAALRDMTAEQYADAFATYRADGFRVHDIESYMVGSQQRYAAIWIKNTNGRGWYAYRDMTAQQYGNVWLQLRDEGYRVTDFEVYDTANGPRYAGVWRQNTDRPNWRLKDDIGRLVEQYVRANGVAGLAVAIGIEDELVYLRGFGHANIAANRVFHSGTIARAASGCKAVAGALAMRLDQTTTFDVGDATRMHAPTLPAFHTHTVAQLLSNRGGVRHYNAGADATKNVNTQYNTALAGSALFQNDPLVNNPGAAYSYSTHGFTLVGAALEGFTGDPIAEILNDRLSAPFNLPTLQAEDRSIPHAQRATLYQGSNSGPVTVTPDNISWKVLGGGCEVSAFDYARFGMKLVNGSILNQDNLDRLWTRPNAQANYALGWSTGTDQDTRVVAHSGSQTGARSYIRVYPDREIVIAILSNQRGHDATQLGRDIGTLILNAGLGANATAELPSLSQIIAPTPPPPADEEILDPQSELGEPFFDVPLTVEPPSVPAADTTEPEQGPFVESPAPVEEGFTVYLPLLRR